MLRAFLMDEKGTAMDGEKSGNQIFQIVMGALGIAATVILFLISNGVSSISQKIHNIEITLQDQGKALNQICLQIVRHEMLLKLPYDARQNIMKNDKNSGGHTP
jgi:hypothetical protein